MREGEKMKEKVTVKQYIVGYWDIETQKNTIITNKENKPITFYDEVKAEEYAYLYSIANSVYAVVMPYVC